MATHAHELPVGVRSAYNYQAAGLLSTADIELPRKVRLRPRRKVRHRGSGRVERHGRTHDDLLALRLEERVRVAQADSVVGLGTDAQDILSLHLVASCFQTYLPKTHGDSDATVRWLDAIERACGTREAFEAVFGIILCDRGIEFDDWAGMERSCLEPDKQRCRVFYCDPMESNQKSECERNHEQLRRILPKGRSHFDELTCYDVATCRSHVNSYPSAGRAGRCPFELAEGVLPQGLLDELGLARVPADQVTLRPGLVAHAVDRWARQDLTARKRIARKSRA